MSQILFANYYLPYSVDLDSQDALEVVEQNLDAVPLIPWAVYSFPYSLGADLDSSFEDANYPFR